MNHYTNWSPTDQANPYVKAVTAFYGRKTTARSEVPLINHIHEGMVVLNMLGAESKTYGAYCLHPMLQSDAQMVEFANPDSVTRMALTTFHYPEFLTVLMLATEYRAAANSFLSNKLKHEYRPSPLPQVKQMLIADKIQNYKDFMEYHYARHVNSKRLHEYFFEWFDLLELSPRCIQDAQARINEFKAKREACAAPPIPAQ